MLTPDIAPEIVTRRRRSIYTAKSRFMDALPKAQSVRLTSRQKRSVMEAVKDHRTMMQKLQEAAVDENPKIIKKRFVPKRSVKVSLGEDFHQSLLLLFVCFSLFFSFFFFLFFLGGRQR